MRSGASEHHIVDDTEACLANKKASIALTELGKYKGWSLHRNSSMVIPGDEVVVYGMKEVPRWPANDLVRHVAKGIKNRIRRVQYERILCEIYSACARSMHCGFESTESRRKSLPWIVMKALSMLLVSTAYARICWPTGEHVKRTRRSEIQDKSWNGTEEDKSWKFRSYDLMR